MAHTHSWYPISTAVEDQEEPTFNGKAGFAKPRGYVPPKAGEAVLWACGTERTCTVTLSHTEAHRLINSGKFVEGRSPFAAVTPQRAPQAPTTALQRLQAAKAYRRTRSEMV